MVQSLKLGGAPNEAPEAGIRRINRLPIIIVIVLVIALLGVIFYGLTSRGLLGQNSGLGDGSGNPASTFADQLKRGVGDAIIGEPQQTTTLQPTPVETQGEKTRQSVHATAGRQGRGTAGTGAGIRTGLASPPAARAGRTIPPGAASPEDGPASGS